MLKRFGVLYEKVTSGLTWVEVVIGGGFLLLMVLVIVYGVIMRYIFRAPTALAFELSAFSMLPVTALGLSYAQRERAHVQVELLTSKLSGRALLIVEIIAWLLFFVDSVLLVWAGWLLAEDHLKTHQTSLNAGIPLLLFSILIPIGVGTLSLQLIIDIKHSVDRLRGKPLERHQPGGH